MSKLPIFGSAASDNPTNLPSSVPPPLPIIEEERSSQPQWVEAGNKIHFISLGCPRNLVDSEVMLGILLRAGYEATDNLLNADYIVINTCGFLEASRKESMYAAPVARLSASCCFAFRRGQLPRCSSWLPRSDDLSFPERTFEKCALGSPAPRGESAFQCRPSIRRIGRLMMRPEMTHIRKITNVMAMLLAG